MLTNRNVTELFYSLRRAKEKIYIALFLYLVLCYATRAHAHTSCNLSALLCDITRDVIM